jgi:hypothetical protein
MTLQFSRRFFGEITKKNYGFLMRGALYIPNFVSIKSIHITISYVRKKSLKIPKG